MEESDWAKGKFPVVVHPPSLEKLKNPKAAEPVETQENEKKADAAGAQNCRGCDERIYMCQSTQAVTIVDSCVAALACCGVCLCVHLHVS